MASGSAMTLTALLSLILTFVASSEAGGISIYWGQHSKERTLAEECERNGTNSSSPLYDYINIGFLTTFGSNRTPMLNLGVHCDPNIDGCEWVSGDIEFCQGRGIKVFLSLGGGGATHSLSSTEDARQVAAYLWNNYLGGTDSTDPRPLGPAILDGIDFYIEGAALYWEDLARSLSNYSTDDQKVYLSAIPECPFPDYWIGKALETGLFDYVWVQFYHNYCEYSPSSITDLVKSWNDWTSSNVTNKVFLGIPRSPTAAGFIPVHNLTYDVLPVIKESDKYGGVMLWADYGEDNDDNYAEEIWPYV